MIDPMFVKSLPDEERKVVELTIKVAHLRNLMGDIEGSNRGHLNLPDSIADAYRAAYRKARNEFDDLRQELRSAIQQAERVSPGCSNQLISMVHRAERVCY
jgi:hypothetical protein